jgi:hypothetical protein
VRVGECKPKDTVIRKLGTSKNCLDKTDPCLRFLNTLVILIRALFHPRKGKEEKRKT